jgi:CRISPR system Cascade subunit CasC
VGGRQRQRISSQAIKRAIRTSDVFRHALEGNHGERTQRLGEELLDELIKKGIEEKNARASVRAVVAAFGKLDEKDSVRTKQLAFISPDERKLALGLAEKAAAGEKLPKEKDLAKEVLLKADTAVDIAMFGRMLADSPDYNRDAAVQVAHAITTNVVEIEDDYYTAVDDLKLPSEDAGAGFIGEAGFGSGIFYLYVCVDKSLLVSNLARDKKLAARGLQALIKALATSSPSGKRNSFANHVRPEFMLLETGDAQPRSLASAFTEAVGPGDQMAKSIARLNKQRRGFAKAFGQDWSEEMILHVGAETTATLDQLAKFASASLQ